MSQRTPALEDLLGCQAATYEWAESFDSKDWERLGKCVAPTLFLDYRTVMGKMWEALPANEFVGLASNPHFLGNQRIKTQHFVGANSKWTQISADEIHANHQMRVAHQKYKDDELTQVQYQGHAHGNAFIQYKKVDGVWKFAGLTPFIRWSEFDYDKIFKDE